jgi:molybdenum cofactor cytidylyltransferase
MGGLNKLLAEIAGKPLVRIVAEQALASLALPVVVVTGHERARVETALRGLNVELVHNPDYANGLSSSLKTGVAALPADVNGAIFCLGDMPQVKSDLINRLIAAFNPDHDALVVVPTIGGKRGNPVVWARRFFPELIALQGDVGAKHLIATNAEVVAEVAVEDGAVLTDVDTVDALNAVRAEMEGAI